MVKKLTVPKERVGAWGDRRRNGASAEVSETVRSEQVELIDADGEPAEGVDGERGTDDGVTR